MKSRKFSALVAASMIWTSLPAAAQVGPNPTPEAPPTQPAPQPGPTSTGGGLFKSDLIFMLAAIAAAVLLTFAATQIGGEDDPESP